MFFSEDKKQALLNKDKKRVKLAHTHLLSHPNGVAFAGATLCPAATRMPLPRADLHREPIVHNGRVHVVTTLCHLDLAPAVNARTVARLDHLEDALPHIVAPVEDVVPSQQSG